MDAWNQKHHTKSGLVKAVQQSTVSLKEAEVATLAFLQPMRIKTFHPYAVILYGRIVSF